MGPKVSRGSGLHLQEWHGQWIGVEGQLPNGLRPSQAVINLGDGAAAPGGTLRATLNDGAHAAQQFTTQDAEVNALDGDDGGSISTLGPEDF